MLLEQSRSQSTVAETTGKTRTRRIQRFAAIVLVFACLVAVAWVEREPLLRGAAESWIVSDPVTEADAAVVLGGGIDIRPFAAAEFYRKGLVKKVLVSQAEDDRAAAIGAVQGHTEINRRVLLSLGVPATDIETFGVSNKSTWDEALALREWTDHHAVNVLIIPTDIFSARRARWIFQRKFDGQAIRILVPSFDPSQYNATNWWKNELGIVAFQNEILKYIYYRLKY
jgi:uncharacterized SAM-binding protein YcdF (DUF218 family)